MLPSEPIFYVYVLFRPSDGSPAYVGKGKNGRWLEHQALGANHRNKHLANVFKVASRLGLEVPALKIRQGLTEQEAFEIEVALIRAIGRKRDGGPLVNATNGGDGSGGHIVPPEIAARSGARMKALWQDPAWRAKAVGRLKGNKRSVGRKLSAETRAKISLGNIGKPSSREPKSAEHRAKIAASLLGRKHSAEAIARMRVAALARSARELRVDADHVDRR